MLEELVQEKLEQKVLELEVLAVLMLGVLEVHNKDHMNVLLLQHALIFLAHILVNVMMDIFVMVNCVQILMNVQRHLVIRKVLKMIKITLHHCDKKGYSIILRYGDPFQADITALRVLLSQILFLIKVVQCSFFTFAF